MLTLELLKEMKPYTVFATGTALDNADGLFMSGSDKELRWVAVRGEIWDWCIYTLFADESIDTIRRVGDKVHMEENIKKCVPCDDEAFKMYRY